ncbi:MAG: GNAT family N-acetyltransferase [Gammaproteobacteria bacterium]|nr:GNAT family N-acetyltransferase [Gammaproteobacteria bacterium]
MPSDLLHTKSTRLKRATPPSYTNFIAHQRSKKNGAGTALINAVIKAARAAKQHTIQLNVNKKNNAIGFYQRHHFQVSYEVVIDIGQGFVMDDFVMQKQL